MRVSGGAGKINIASKVMILIMGTVAMLPRGGKAMFTVKTADALVGGLSAPSKMPCPSFSISAFMCQTGGSIVEALSVPCALCATHEKAVTFSLTFRPH